MSRPVRRFVRHYAEMCLAMGLGMAGLGILIAALGPLGLTSDDIRSDVPALLLLAMATSMTAPMVWWMRRRGHGWAASAEMAAAMFLPTFAVVGMLAGGLVQDIETLVAIQHVVMFPAMLVAMLLRRSEYTGGHAHVGAAVECAT